MAEAVLNEHGAPLHWREMAERAERLGHRRSFNQQGFYNSLSLSEGLTRVGPGTYALAKWGYTAAIPYPDIIAEVFAGAGRPLTFGDLSHRVQNRRPVNVKSLQMMLDMHPRFYTSVNGLHGLRAWLPPRQKQSLLTPDELVEPDKSYRRVARAEARGYRVEDMLRSDREHRYGVPESPGRL